jgi:hypothetical protein
MGLRAEEKAKSLIEGGFTKAQLLHRRQSRQRRILELIEDRIEAMISAKSPVQ